MTLFQLPGPAADTLQKLPVKVVTYEKCHANMRYLNEIKLYNGLHPDKTICAGGEYGNDLHFSSHYE